ncbi:MAG: alkaline phosphatase family protein [Planctomycetes bacterium]|nr:alkaline phosphatase family protein [Planctomycetota bacterium]
MARRRVLLIGLDAADLAVMRAHLARLPRLRALFQSSPPRTLRSPGDVLSSAVWPSFASGTGPGVHGVYYPLQWDHGGKRLRRVDADWLAFEPFWYPLAREGVRVTTLDVPFSLPSRMPAGVEVVNWGSQECLGPFASNRPELAREILRRFGKHPMGQDVPVESPPARLEAIRTRLVAGAAQKAELARWLLESTDPELFVVVFAELHRGGHVLWRGSGDDPGPALLDVYAAIDAALGRLLDSPAAADAEVVLFSTHGTGANLTQEHFMLPVLERFHATRRGEGPASGEPKPKKASPMRWLRAAIPGQVQYLLAKALPAGVRDFVVQRALLGGVDWDKDVAFALPMSGEGYLRVLDPSGVDALRACLLELRDAATDRPLVREVVTPPSRYPGPRADRLPDLVVLWAKEAPATAIRSERLGRIEARLTTGRTGEHRGDGFVCVRGAGAATAPDDVTGLASFTRELLGSRS